MKWRYLENCEISLKNVQWWHLSMLLYLLSNSSIAYVVLRDLDLHFGGKQFEMLISGKRWELMQKYQNDVYLVFVIERHNCEWRTIIYEVKMFLLCNCNYTAQRLFWICCLVVEWGLIYWIYRWVIIYIISIYIYVYIYIYIYIPTCIIIIIACNMYHVCSPFQKN